MLPTISVADRLSPENRPSLADVRNRLFGGMPVKVRFPDGEEREVPSTLRAVRNATASSLVDVPNEHPDWRFIPMEGRWVATPRKRH